MKSLPFEVRVELDGWVLFWADLELSAGDKEPLADLRREVAGHARERFDLQSLSADPTVAALRRLFRRAGTDPTRYRPSSEALLRRLLKGDELPAINPLVDISNCLSAELAVPCCVMADGTIAPPLLFRSGRPGENYLSLRGPFNLDGKPLLCDSAGPLDCPITGNDKVKVTLETQRAWLVAYMPSETSDPVSANKMLEEMVRRVPAIQILRTAAC
ncbi:MAG: hypothetical protein JSW58_12630 [Candidatus Latescibacterota bacterium]|nr:MAG: hypothetical protein JSW58_12630 [Candidatus Latescibacterota bacterium]